MADENVIKTVNRLNQILEYVSIGGNNLVEDDENMEAPQEVDPQVANGGIPDIGGDPGQEGNGELQDQGGDGNEMQMGGDEEMPNGVEGFSPEESIESDGTDGDSDEEVIDVDELVDSQETTEKKVDRMNAKFEKLYKALKKFEDSIDSNSKEISNLANDMAKRNPTPIEKLSLRSKDGYPFNVSVDEYWADKENSGSNYSKEDDNNGEENPIYTITKNDIDGVQDWHEISKSLDNIHPFTLKDIMDY